MDELREGDPRQVGAYPLPGRLGGGGMGQVFLGVSPGGRRVAVKVIRPELAADPEFLRRFAREIDAARRVGGFHTAPSSTPTRMTTSRGWSPPTSRGRPCRW